MINLQITTELETYDSHANGSFSHTWYHGDGLPQKVYFPSPTFGLDANRTFAVSS